MVVAEWALSRRQRLGGDTPGNQSKLIHRRHPDPATAKPGKHASITPRGERDGVDEMMPNVSTRTRHRRSKTGPQHTERRKRASILSVPAQQRCAELVQHLRAAMAFAARVGVVEQSVAEDEGAHSLARCQRA